MQWLPTHPSTGLHALGLRKDGRLIWPVLGAEDPPDGQPDGDGGKPTDDDKGGYKPPATQADLDRILGERVARERAKYSDYSELQKKAKERDAAVQAAKTDAELAVEKARGEGRDEAAKAGNGKLIRAEVRAAAAELRFRDPKDAARYLDDLDTIKVSDSGDVDGAEVKRRLEQLGKDKSYLLMEEKPGKPKADKSQGGNPGSQTAGVSAGRDMYDTSRSRKPNSTKE